MWIFVLTTIMLDNTITLLLAHVCRLINNNSVGEGENSTHLIHLNIQLCPILEYSCNKYCESDLIGHSEVSISHRDLQV